jgi:cytochrome c553
MKLGIAVFLVLALSTVLSSSAAPVGSANVAHGKYLAEAVGMCGDCHSDERKA